MNTSIADREAFKLFRRTRRLNRLVQRLRLRCEHSDESLRIITQILEKTANTPTIVPILKALNNKN
jgi:NADH:ubiquinone oxidoreductase subunit D